MGFHSIVSCILFASVIAGTVGYNSPGLTLPSQFLNPLGRRLTSIVSKCKRDEPEFPIEQVKSNITSCLQLFNELGAQEVEYAEVKYPESWEDEAQVTAYRASSAQDRTQRRKHWCSQLKSTLQCFGPIKPIFEECQNPEGITLFSFAEELCDDDAAAYMDFVDAFALPSCARSQESQLAIESCGKDFEKYFGRKFDPANVIYKFCEIGSLAVKCLREGLAASPTGCARASELLQAFTERIKSRASSPDALAQCISSGF